MVLAQSFENLYEKKKQNLKYLSIYGSRATVI